MCDLFSVISFNAGRRPKLVQYKEPKAKQCKLDNRVCWSLEKWMDGGAFWPSLVLIVSYSHTFDKTLLGESLHFIFYHEPYILMLLPRVGGP